MSKFRVLSFDGGGVRGLLTTMLLQRLCSQPGLSSVFESVDLFAGNSSGGLVALAMAHGLEQTTMQATLAITRGAFEKAEEVFGPFRLPRLGFLPHVPIELLEWIFRSKYRGSAREKAVKELLKDKTLRQLPRHVLITAFDLDNEGMVNGQPVPDRMWKPKIFHNLEVLGDAQRQQSDGDVPAWKAAMYSTSAITYFPAVDGFVDGGIYANNPSMCALAQVFDKRYKPNPKPPLQDVVLLSIGAGQSPEVVKGQSASKGLLYWAWGGRFVRVATDATVGVADYECRQMLGESNYRRLAPIFPEGTRIDLDSFDQLEFLTQFVDRPDVNAQIEQCAQWLREHWMPGLRPNIVLTEATSKHVGTATELTCLMPIRPGFIPMLETRTYATRLRVLFTVLQALRVASREVRRLKPVLDIVEAAQTVQSFSWTIVAERQLLLTVSFDRPWEPYIRAIWKDLGPLLDLILCSCEGFVPSSEGFEPFAAYVRQHQVDTGFFYPSSSLTVNDESYLREFEKTQRDRVAPFDLQAATLRTESASQLAAAARNADPGDAASQWLAALDALYGLRIVYPETSADHIYLQRAATALLDSSRPTLPLPPSPELDWFNLIERPPVPEFEPRLLEHKSIQGGILTPYKGVTSGCLLLARVDDGPKARAFIGELIDTGHQDQIRDPLKISREPEPDHGTSTERSRSTKQVMNIAFTPSGLRNLGVKESDLLRFPKEFREGMNARAGLLGDVRQNHPDNWRLPVWNVDADSRPSPPIRMSTVDLVLAIYEVNGSDTEYEWTRQHSLYSCVQALVARARGIQVLAVEPMHRLRPKGDRPTVKAIGRDHFGFNDGISQPRGVPKPRTNDEVELGELFVGFQNERGDPPFPAHSENPSVRLRGSLLDSGSFLVIRKLQQNVPALECALNKAKQDRNIERDDLLEKMLGRSLDGIPLLKTPPQTATNDFDFKDDPNGEICPFHAHIRRGNPRLPNQNVGGAGAQPLVPRIARRALAYGPAFDERTRDEDRGMMFMVYNASIAEQFEILQRWMSGGNTPTSHGGTTVFSGQPDPLLGLPDPDGKRIYRFVDQQHNLQHVDFGDTPFVTLQWGLYLFAPSIPALELLAKDPGPDPAKDQAIVAMGNDLIQRLTTQADWAAMLEDVSANQSGATAAVFAAIRASHGGAMRTPYGIVVADKDLAMEVLRDDSTFSVHEYQRRFALSVGKSYLGMDRGPEYTALSTPANATLDLVTEEQACREAFTFTQQAMKKRIRPAEALPLEPVVDEVLAELARTWFDVPDGTLIKVGRRPENNDDMHCPFNFLAPSRYVFSSPNPRETVTQLGETNGTKLLEQVRTFVEHCQQNQRANGDSGLRGEISRALFEAIPYDDDLLARTLLGLVFGFVPTVYGSALQVLNLWLGDETLWRVQQRMLEAIGHEADDDPAHKIYRTASAVLRIDLERAMQTRPVPPLLHRTVIKARPLRWVSLNEGDRVVVGMAGVTQQALSRGASDVMPIFGGDRNVPDHPIHACPGYHIAMGVLLGLLSAILTAGTLTPAPGLLTVRVTPN